MMSLQEIKAGLCTGEVQKTDDGREGALQRFTSMSKMVKFTQQHSNHLYKSNTILNSPKFCFKGAVFSKINFFMAFFYHVIVLCPPQKHTWRVALIF